MEVAGWVASPIISELFQKCSSYLAFDASEKLQQLEPKVLLLERAMQAVERSPDRPRLEKLSENLRTAFYEAEDILDDIEYRCLEKKIQDDKFRSDGSAPPRKRDWGKKTVKSALPGSLPKNKETGTSKNELKDSLEKIEDIINEACTLLKKLNLSSVSDFNGTQAVATMSRGAATTSAPQPVVIGRDKDRDKIIAMLHEKDGDGQPITNNGLCYSVIGIHGIGGSGKSTLAQLVCARERMDRQEKRDDHFDLVMWVHVSQSFSVDAIFKEIFEAATGDSCPQLDNLDTLQNKLEEKLHGKRFLLVLDDIWCNIRDERQKGNLRQILSPLKAGEAGSKILVTSRTEDALSVMGAAKPKRIPISDLDDDVFQSLLMHYAFEGAAIDENVRRRLNAIGGEIAKKLKGSPLAARIVGGQLGRRPDVEFWTRFKDKKLVDGTMGALWWSYHHLSPQARRCFAYCSIFPRRHHLHRGELVKLWVAEGFIRNTGAGEEMEDVCREHFDELVSTSFLQPGVKEHKDDNKYYLLHDLLHDLAETVAGSDCFRIENDLTWRGGDLIDDGWTGGIPNPRDVRHLFVQRYDGELITEKILQLENLRTLIIYTITGDDTTVEEKVIESIFKRLPKLRVLAIGSRDHCKRLLERPDILSVSESICQLKHLRYLGFHPPRSCRIILPSTLTKLYHIQHLDFGLCEEIEFPPADLINLGHVSFYKGPTSPGKEDAQRIRPWAVVRTERRVLALALVFRAVNALLVRTYFNPDEHWQCLEVAHRVAFGYGHLTWEWKQGLRSYLHPLIFAALYKILALLHLDTPWFMVMAPRLLQSVFASFGDLYLYKLSKLIFDDHVAQWTLFSQLVNWFMFFCITRTLSNSLETVLTVAGLYYWFMAIESSKGTSVVSKQQATSYQNDPSRKVALLIAALACAIRPTSAITWLYVGLLDFIQIKSKCQFLFLEVIPLGVIVLAVTTFLDWWMYGSWVIVPLNFLKFNLFSSGGDYYGTHIFHWYFTQGFPSMVWTFLPFSVFGVMKSREWRLSGLIAWVLGVYSILGHKEFRFVLPVLPLALMFSGYCLASTSRFKGKSLHRRGHLSRLELSVILLIISNVPMALYMSIFHQRGTEDVMFYLSKEAHDGRVKAVLFLMPCHSTPYYSTLHKSLPMRFLDCTPSENIGILDESDRFLMNPPDFVGEVFGNLSSFSHIVLYESEERHVLQFLLRDSFQEVMRFFHSHFKIDRDLQSSVVVYSRRDVL